MQALPLVSAAQTAGELCQVHRLAQRIAVVEILACLAVQLGSQHRGTMGNTESEGNHALRTLPATADEGEMLQRPVRRHAPG